ncbi:phosphotransferase family protein [Candidatus Uabimicrobium amorphum]|nr:aminoglycoside phosphotransferase family protein [Candidatus Uabimicrobium amorphum]
MSAMKYGWQRLNPVVELAQQQVTDILRPFFPGQKVRDIQLLSGGLANTSYCCIFHNDRKVLLRVYTRDANSCLLEKTIHDLLQHGIPIAEILHMDTSKNIIPYSFAVMQWIDGISLREAIIREPQRLAQTFFQLGFPLYYLQKYRFEEVGMLDENLNVTPFIMEERNPFFRYVKECLQSTTTQKNIGESLCEKIDSYIDVRRGLYREIFHHPHLTHGDYNPANVLVCPRTFRVVAILDWEFAFSGSFYCDIGNMLRDEEVYVENCVAQFICGLQEAGIKLHDNWREMCKLVDLTSLVGFAHTSNCEKVIEDVVHLIKRTVL